MHLHKKVSVTACTMAVQLAELAAAITVEACLKVASSSGAPDSAAISTVGERVAAVLEELRNIDKVCEVEAPGALMPVERPLLAPFAASQKHFAFFSLIQEIADVLQNDAESRQHVESSTAEWSTGKFRTPPTVMTDVVHGQRFRESPASRPATALELAGPKRWRIVIQPWNDDATVSTTRHSCWAVRSRARENPQNLGRVRSRAARVASNARAWESARISHRW